MMYIMQVACYKWSDKSDDDCRDWKTDDIAKV